MTQEPGNKSSPGWTLKLGRVAYLILRSDDQSWVTPTQGRTVTVKPPSWSTAAGSHSCGILKRKGRASSSVNLSITGKRLAQECIPSAERHLGKYCLQLPTMNRHLQDICWSWRFSICPPGIPSHTSFVSSFSSSSSVASQSSPSSSFFPSRPPFFLPFFRAALKLEPKCSLLGASG